MNKCRICGNAEGNKTYSVKEMMFGFNEMFEYFECSKCNCLQIEKIPEDLSRYYPEGYYSYAPPRVIATNPVKKYFKRLLVANVIGRKNPVGWLLSKLFEIPPFAVWMREAGADFVDAILDVGSGAGELLLNMESLGFTNLIGIDPFIAEDIFYDNGVSILKMSLDEVEGEFDVIMLHHSLEHMPDSHQAFDQLNRLLKPRKSAVVRIPVAASHAWRKYGTNWAAIDAPRHIYLHTEESLSLLAEKHGFVIEKIVYDSTSMQIWWSEQNRMGIPLMDERSLYVNPDSTIFTADQIRGFEERARELNSRGEGDTACFYLRKC